MCWALFYESQNLYKELRTDLYTRKVAGLYGIVAPRYEKELSTFYPFEQLMQKTSQTTPTESWRSLNLGDGRDVLFNLVHH